MDIRGVILCGGRDGSGSGLPPEPACAELLIQTAEERHPAAQPKGVEVWLRERTLQAGDGVVCRCRATRRASGAVRDSDHQPVADWLGERAILRALHPAERVALNGVLEGHAE